MPIYKLTLPPPDPLVFKGNNTVVLAGCKVTLTAGEYALLYFIAKRAPDIITPSDLLEINMAPKSLPVLVCSINKKAKIISERKLILTERCRGYRLNPYP